MSAPRSLPSEGRPAPCSRAALRACRLLGALAVVLLASDLFAEEPQPVRPAADAVAAPPMISVPAAPRPAAAGDAAMPVVQPAGATSDGAAPTPALDVPAAAGSGARPAAAKPPGAGAPPADASLPPGPVTDGGPVASPLPGIGTLPDELSPVGMFLHADVVVKVVMIGLALASLLTWTVWLSKTIELTLARRRARAAVRVLRAAPTLGDAATALRGRHDVVARLVIAAEAEVELSADCPQDGVKERLTWDLERIEAAASRRIALGMGLLATVGAVAPFVGLFGTVWGIMNSFIGISRAHTTNLAVVAPGIAEALLATAFGLVAAIPAVVIYNVFTRSIGSYRAVLRDASVAILRLVSRDLDRPAHRDAEGTPIKIATGSARRVSEAAE